MQKRSQVLCCFFITLFLVMNICANGQPSLKDETRLPWAMTHGGFIRDWLIVGGFPIQDGKRYDVDFLAEHQGEINIKPVAGMTHTLPDGSTIEWKPYHSPYNYINFLNVLKDINFYEKIAYAHATVHRSQKGKVILSFGSTVGNKIWVNGKLVYANEAGGPVTESHHVEVEMVEGENSILMKSIMGGWTWGFTLRIIDPKSISLIHDCQLSPSILKSTNNKLTIKTDQSLNPTINNFDVQVNATAAGGKVISQKTTKRGETITFNTKEWPDGVYDICFKSHNNRGKVETAYLFWYKGDAIKAAKELVSQTPENPETPPELIHAMLVEMIHDRLGNDLNQVDESKIETIYSPLMEYEELKLNAAGQQGTIRPNGFVRLAYRDEIDGTPQFCRAYLPMYYDQKKKWPLVLQLHGYNPANPVYVRWWAVDSRHAGTPDRYPVIYMEPHGRGNASYRGIGKRDVLRCIKMAKKHFNVDEDKVYITGDSMGGGGTWYVGTRHPELLAAIAPVFGGWDYHVFMDEEYLANLTERERFIEERGSSFAQAEALFTTPVLVIHGDVDKSVDVNHSRYVVNMLQRWGYDIRYHEFPHYGHEGIEREEEVLEWFQSHKRNAHPRQVRVRSAYLKSASAHWVKVTQRDDPYSFIHAEAEVLLDNTIRLSTENVLEIELSPQRPLINPQKPLKIIWNVNDIRETKLTNGKTRLQANSYRPTRLVKNPIIEGAISDITTTPFAVVIGTISDDSLMVKLCKQKAQNFINDWKEWQKYEPRVFNDTELTEEDMKRYSLILYGGANANLIAKKLSDKIPLEISSHEIKIADKAFEVEDACMQMIYPHPLNADRYVSIIGATSGAGMYFYNQRNTDFDFFIQDGCVPNRRQGRPMEKLYVARGVFDYNWQISEKLLETGDSELREKSPVRKVLPNLTTTLANLPQIDPQIFNTLVGKYEIEPGVVVTVFREGDKLMGQGPDGNPLQLHPSSESEYFIDVMDLQLTFGKNESGDVDHVIIHQRGQDMKAMKIE